MTELSPVGTMTTMKDEVLGSCGILLPQTEAKIVDIANGDSLPTGKTGELCIRGPQVTSFNSYVIPINSRSKCEIEISR